jgi:hypothetical protein
MMSTQIRNLYERNNCQLATSYKKTAELQYTVAQEYRDYCRIKKNTEDRNKTAFNKMRLQSARENWKLRSNAVAFPFSEIFQHIGRSLDFVHRGLPSKDS